MNQGESGGEVCHIQVQFACPALKLDYQDERSVADRFAAAAPGIGAVVTIDGALRDGLLPLPCRRLWT